MNLVAELNRRASLFRRLVLPGGNLLDNETQPKQSEEGRQYREDEVLGKTSGGLIDSIVAASRAGKNAFQKVRPRPSRPISNLSIPLLVSNFLCVREGRCSGAKEIQIDRILKSFAALPCHQRCCIYGILLPLLLQKKPAHLVLENSSFCLCLFMPALTKILPPSSSSPSAVGTTTSVADIRLERRKDMCTW